MGDMGPFSVVQVDVDRFLGVLSRFVAIQHACDRQKVLRIMRDALVCGASIAGGAARMMYASRTCTSGNDKTWVSLLLTEYRRTLDVDLFFQTEQSLYEFLGRLSGVRHKSSVTGCAINVFDDKHVIHKDAAQYVKPMFQVICLPGGIGDVRDVLSQFDIYPSMVALNNDGFIIPERCVLWDERRLFGVHEILTPITLRRISKYVRRYGKFYNAFDSESSALVANKLLQYAFAAKNNNVFKYAATGWEYHRYYATYDASSMLHMMKLSDVLAVSFIDCEGYDSTFGKAMRQCVKMTGHETGVVTQR